MAVTAPADKIGEQLIHEGLVTREQLSKALDDARSSGNRVGFSLVKLGFMGEQDLVRALARQHRIPAVDLERVKLDPKILKLVPGDIAIKHQVLPLRRVGRTLTVAMANPTDLGVLDDLKFVTRLDIEPVIAGDFSLKKIIEKEYEGGADERINDLLRQIEGEDVEVVEDREEEMSVGALTAAVEEAPVVKLINGILTDAVNRGASDIHFECYEKDIRVRYLVDGVLAEIMRPPIKMKAALISRFKILSDLNIAERRVPQDGRIKLRLGRRVIDFRVSTLPTLFGEKIVLRILDKSNLTLDLEKFGMEEKAERDFMKAIMNPYGMVLVTGPTGSGKTTTLYSALSKINTPEVNIMTAEDPVEYNLHGINQVLVRTEIGMTFAAALKAFLRQDPNIIMVGEIRDLETGSIAIKAALTGHLVLSTLHTNDAPSSVTRLINIGVEPYLISAALNAILAQRLVRKICQKCKVEFEPTGEMKEFLTLQGYGAEKSFKGAGCDKCRKTGYSGRLGIFELLVMDDGLRDTVTANPDVNQLRKLCRERGLVTLRQDGFEKVKKGLTTIDEIIRVTENA